MWVAPDLYGGSVHLNRRSQRHFKRCIGRVIDD